MSEFNTGREKQIKKFRQRTSESTKSDIYYYTEKTGESNMWEYMKERILRNAKYIIERRATVRACAQHFGLSKSTVHMEVMIRNGLFG